MTPKATGAQSLEPLLVCKRKVIVAESLLCSLRDSSHSYFLQSPKIERLFYVKKQAYIYFKNFVFVIYIVLHNNIFSFYCFIYSTIFYLQTAFIISLSNCISFVSLNKCRSTACGIQSKYYLKT